MDLPILKYLDVLIGLAVVMLIASTVITAITQVYLNATYARARYLRDGLAQLLAQIDPNRLSVQSRYLAERLQRHPLVGRANALPFTNAFSQWRNCIRAMRDLLPLPGFNPGDVLQREEIILSLLEWAAEEGPLALQDRELAAQNPGHLQPLAGLRRALREALSAAGIQDPATVARSIRQFIVENESANPSLPAHTWRSQAVAKAALSDLTAKVFAWYDNAMARVSDFFALEAKIAASLIALVFCLATQLDSIDLLRRLSVDEKFRATMVAQADNALKLYEKASEQKSEDAMKKAQEQLREAKDMLAEAKFDLVSHQPIKGKRLPGILLSWIFLSLGAPFWYDLLKKLLGLRSLLQNKDEEERKQRQAEQPPPTPAPAAVSNHLKT